VNQLSRDRLLFLGLVLLTCSGMELHELVLRFQRFWIQMHRLLKRRLRRTGLIAPQMQIRLNEVAFHRALGHL
jgi:hypothetical protein